MTNEEIYGYVKRAHDGILECVQIIDDVVPHETALSLKTCRVMTDALRLSESIKDLESALGKDSKV